MRGFILTTVNKSNLEISMMFKAASELDIQLEIIDPQLLTVLLDPDKPHILLEGLETPIPDFAIAAFAKDPSYGNIACLQQLEAMGVLCVNRASVLETTKDKMLTLQKLSAVGIPVPKTILNTRAATLPVIQKELGFPLVLKVIGGSKGDGVILVNTPEELENTLQIANAGNLQEELIMQKMISTSKGRDLRVVVVNGKTYGCAQRKAPTKDGFKANFSAGGSIASYKLDEKIIDITNRVSEVLGLFIGGVDLLFTDEGYVVCEVNSIPGLYYLGWEHLWGDNNVFIDILKSIKNELSKKA